jgi:hypothetical protein
MKKSSPSNRSVTLGRAQIWCWILVGTLPLQTGCGWFASAPRKPVSVPVVAPPATNEDVLKVYLQTMSALISNDPARQSDVFFEVEREYKKVPTTTARLRYALALVTPNHPGSKPSEGKRILEALLNDPDRLTPPERTFADILFGQVAARLKLENDDRRAVATLEERARTQASSDKRTIAQQADEIARLKRALAESEQKLDAIKEIERSLIERSPTSPGNRDNPSETQSPAPGR